MQQFDSVEVHVIQIFCLQSKTYGRSKATHGIWHETAATRGNTRPHVYHIQFSVQNNLTKTYIMIFRQTKGLGFKDFKLIGSTMLEMYLV